MRRKNLGELGENLALQHLKNKGYKILTRNFRSKFGEIDIVAQDNDFLVFVEVKTRWSKKYGSPERAVTPWKIRRITKAGQYYKILHPRLPEALRIDLVAIDLSPNSRAGEIRLVKNITG